MHDFYDKLLDHYPQATASDWRGGTLLEYTDANGSAAIHWTHEKSLVSGSATRRWDSEGDQLYEWWVDTTINVSAIQAYSNG